MSPLYRRHGSARAARLASRSSPPLRSPSSASMPLGQPRDERRTRPRRAPSPVGSCSLCSSRRCAPCRSPCSSSSVSASRCSCSRPTASCAGATPWRFRCRSWHRTPSSLTWLVRDPESATLTRALERFGVATALRGRMPPRRDRARTRGHRPLRRRPHAVLAATSPTRPLRTIRCASPPSAASTTRTLPRANARSCSRAPASATCVLFGRASPEWLGGAQRSLHPTLRR